ncbi:DUF7221 family queuine tRNA-ribosyltransferase-like protein [Amycolatopsis coloradensis]|uniref:deazapurine DNA modification protein DpdA family protein n=1 Tax=Amycolatopsis coloradensis TaxID=76021 RepID=UPI001ABF5F11|nr:hypothetical protein [Amycolatopsis coloradensis]
MGFTGWSQRDTLTTGHGHCRDNRRQHSGQVERIVRSLHARGLRLHCFGVKTTGLARYGDAIRSSDSAVWSYSSRYLPGCSPSHRSESNCLTYALAWHTRLQHTLRQSNHQHGTRRRAASQPSPRGLGRGRPGHPGPRRTQRTHPPARPGSERGERR